MLWPMKGGGTFRVLKPQAFRQHVLVMVEVVLVVVAAAAVRWEWWLGWRSNILSIMPAIACYKEGP